MADSQAGETTEGAPPTVTDRANFDRSKGPLARVEALRPLALKHSAAVQQKVYDKAIEAGDDPDTACRNAKIARNKAYLTALGLEDGAPKLQTPRQTRPRGPPAEPREGERKSARLKDGLPADYSGDYPPEALALMRKRELEEAGMIMDDEPEEEQQQEEEEEASIPDDDEDEEEDEDDDDEEDDDEEEDVPPARVAAGAPRAMPVKAPGKKKAAPQKRVARDIEASPEEEAEDGNVWELRPGEDQEAFVARLMAEMEKDAGKKKAASRKRVACDIVASPEEEEDDVWKRRPGEDDKALIARLEAEIEQESRSEDGCKKKQRKKVGKYRASLWAATKKAGSGASRGLIVEVVGDAPIRGFEDISLDSVTQALYGPAAPYNGSAARLYQNEGARNYPRQTLGNGMRGWPRQLGDRGCVGDLRKPDYVFIQELPNQGDVHVFIQEGPPKKKQRGGGPTPSTPMVSDDTEDEPEAGHCTIC